MNKRSLERIPIRTRESNLTHSAWVMEVETEGAHGTITMIESGGTRYYRGNGLFLGWSQEDLAKTYDELNTPSDEPPFELQQLG